MLFVEAGDTAPRGVLGEEDDQNIERRGDNDGHPAEDAEDPVAGAVTARPIVHRPSRSRAARRQEDDEDQAGQPGRFSWNHLDFQKVQRNRGEQQHEQRERKGPGRTAKSFADGPSRKESRNAALDRIPHLKERKERDDHVASSSIPTGARSGATPVRRDQNTGNGQPGNRAKKADQAQPEIIRNA